MFSIYNIILGLTFGGSSLLLHGSNGSMKNAYIVLFLFASSLSACWYIESILGFPSSIEQSVIITKSKDTFYLPTITERGNKKE